MIHKYVSRTVLLFLVLDQLVLVGSLALALWLKTHWILADPQLPVRAHIDLFVRLWPFLVLALIFSGAYDFRAAVGRLRPLLRRTLVGAAIMACVWIAGSFYLKLSGLFQYSRAVFTLFLLFSTMGLLGVRLAVAEAVSYYKRRTGRHRRVLVFGGDALGRRIVATLQRQLFSPTRVVGITGSVEIPGVPRISEEEALGQIRQGAVDYVVIDLTPRRLRMIQQIARLAEREGVPIQITPTILPGVHLKPRMSRLGRVPVLELSGDELPLSGALAKRGIDLAGSSLGLVVLAPLFLMIAIGIKLTSRGPVFYRQRRIGQDGNEFCMFKFRTMREDAEAHTGPVWATPDDPRVTPFGRFLRRTNLDELPQLVNVLLGSMSLVGPRPERPEFVEQFKPVIDRYSHKHWVKPGITGWAQVNGWRGPTDLKRRIEHDIYYIERWSLWFDVKILAWTLLRGGRSTC